MSEFITDLSDNRISFLWIQGQFSIGGNEIVDTLAKNSSEKSISVPYKYRFQRYGTGIQHLSD